jgi:hypothetical protein
MYSIEYVCSGGPRSQPAHLVSIYRPPLSATVSLHHVLFLYAAYYIHRVFIKWEDLIHLPLPWIYDTTLSMRDMIILNVLH